MKKQITLGLFCMAFYASLYGQNLVPNPSFEDFISCPVTYNPGFGPLLATPWFVPTMGSSDYFNACNGGVVGVPNNAFATLPAHTGVAYAGGLYYYAGIPNYREYLQVQLTEPLVAGQSYTVNLYYAVGNLTCPIDKLGIHFDVGQITEPLNIGPMAITPQLELNVGLMETDWQLFTDCYIALGGEEWMTIGNFYSDGDVTLGSGCPLWEGFIISYVFIDDVSIEEGPPPGDVVFSLGPDTVVCGDFDITVPVDPAYYVWQDGTHDQTFTATESGIYHVTVTSGCNVGVDTIEITILPEIEPVDLGEPEVTICPGDVISYNFNPIYGDYLWQDGSTSPNYQITTAGTYSVTLTNDCGVYEDQIIVDVLDPPAPFNLGNDTTLCPLTTLLLAVDPMLGDFTWQDGSTNPAITVSEPGTYALTISNMCGESEDEIEVMYYPDPLVFFAEDSIPLCDGETFEINFDPEIGEYFWNDGSLGPDYVIDGPGVYSVTVSNPCGSDFSSVVADYDFEPEVDLGPDLTLCPQQLPYTINLQGLLDVEHFLWDDGTTDPDFTVVGAGTYGVTVSNDCFEVWDFITITVEDAPPSVNLPADTTLCGGEQLFLDVQSVPGTYEWQDGSQTGVYLVTESGTYSVTVTNACGEDSDEIVVEFTNDLPGLDLGPDMSLCPGEQTIIYAGVTGVEYEWQDGSTLDSFIVSDEQTVILTISSDCGFISDTVEITVNAAAPDAMLPASLAICEGESVTIQTGIAGATYAWSNGGTGPSIIASIPGEYILTVTNACGMDIDTTVVMDLGPAPVVDLGADLSICPGEMAVFDPGSAGNYMWNDGGTGTTFTATDSGYVVVTISNQCGADTDSAYVSLLEDIPVLDLGADTSVCPGESVSFDPGIPNVNYTWSDGSSGQSYTAMNGGEVYLEISNTCGTSSDTVNIGLLPDAPVLNLGQDFSICPGESVTLDPGVPGVSYSWGDGSSGTTFDVTGPGEITLTVSNACGLAADTITVTEDLNGPMLDLGADVSVCEGESVTITPGLNGVQYLWQDGSTANSIDISSTTTVILQVSNACGMATDTVEVVVSGSGPVVELGPDMLLCDGEEITLSVDPAGNSITWNDGSNNASLIVADAGTYAVTVTNSCGETTDSIAISTEDSPAPFDLGEDQTICPGDEVILTTPDTQPGSSLIWNTGSEEDTLVVSSAGNFTLTISNACGQATDAVSISIDPNQIQVPAQDYYTLCEGESVIADVTQMFDADYQWSDGSTAPVFTISDVGMYGITITSNCDLLENAVVVEEGDCGSDEVFIPNVFSPNFDNINDFFSIEFDHTQLTAFSVSIFDRWGALIYTSADPGFEWDGIYRDEPLMPGVYVYHILIDREGERSLSLKGDVTLIR